MLPHDVALRAKSRELCSLLALAHVGAAFNNLDQGGKPDPRDLIKPDDHKH
jgi:hypothetical protein